mgnify:CR=1 FL=1
MGKYLDAIACLLIIIRQIVIVLSIAAIVQGSVYQLSGKRISIWNIYRKSMLKGVSKTWVE